MLVEVVGDLGGFAPALGAQAHKHMGLCCITDAVVELGHVARQARQFADQLAKALKAAALLGNGHRKQRLALLAHLGAFCYKAQPVEVHVGAAQNRRIGLAPGLVLGYILLDGGHCQCAGRLHDAAGVYKHVLDGRAHRVGVHGHEFIYQVASDAKGLFPHQFDCCAVREQPHIRQRDPLPGDHVVIDGGLASAKLSKAQADHVMRVFARMELRVPGGFFSDAVGAAGAAGVGTGEVDADADDFTWDRGEDEAAEAAAEADRKAGLKIRAANLKAGGTKMLEVAAAGTRADADAVVAADRDARAAVAAAVIPTSAPVALAAVEAPIKVKNTGPSRAERRAAAQEAAEIAAEIAVAMAGMKTTTTTADDDDELDLTKI